MKKLLLTLSLTLLAVIAPATASSEVNAEISGKYVRAGSALNETFTPGWYLLYNVGRNNYVSEETTVMKMRQFSEGLVDDRANFLFKIYESSTEGKYIIESANGKYFSLGGNSSSMSETPRDFEIGNVSGDIFYMRDVESNYIADGQGTGDNFVGYGTDVPTADSGNARYRFISAQISELGSDRAAMQNISIPYVYKLQQLYGLVKSASRYESNRKESGEGSYEALIDNDYSTFFHSSWSSASADITNGVKHNLQANLKRTAGNFRFYFAKRSQNDNDRPIDITIQGSTDGSEFSDITTINSGLPTEAENIGYMSDVIDGGDYTHIRFVVNTTSSTASNPAYRCFFTFSEFYMLPENDDVKAAAEIITALNASDAGSDLSELAASMFDNMAAIDEARANTSIDVTIALPSFGSISGATVTTSLPVGTDLSKAANLPAVNFARLTGVDDADKVVDEDTRSFTASGAWTFPFELDKVYRADLRKSEANGCKNWAYDYETGRIKTNNGDNADAFEPERLFFLSGDSFDGTTLKVTLHCLATGSAKGFQVASIAANDALGSITETPTVLCVATNTTGTAGFSLAHSERPTWEHLNDVRGILGAWANGSASQNDGGSFIRFKSLADADFDGLMTGDNASFFTEENVNAAKATHSVADMTTLFADYVAAISSRNIAIAAANLAVSNAGQYTGSGDNLRIGDGLNLYSGTTVDAINACIDAVNAAIEGTDIAAIESATANLNDEVGKLTMNMPAAGSFLRVRATTQGMPYLVAYNSEHPDKNTHGKLVGGNVDVAGTYFYYDGSSLLGYKNGYYARNNGNFLGFISGEEQIADNAAASIAFDEGTGIQVGTYLVKFSGNRYLYAGSSQLTVDEETTTYLHTDAGSTADRAGYTWWLEQLSSIPVTFDETLYTTLVAPVQLVVPDDISAYIVTSKNGTTITLTLVDTGIIPANTPVILKAIQAGTVDFYFYDGTATREVAASPILAGSLHAIAAPAGVYTLQMPEGKEIGMYPAAEGSVVNGFNSYMTAEHAAGQEGYTLNIDGSTLTGIGEVEAAESGVDVIFDLQGRRLNAPVKGINIINGKKILVK